MATDLQALAFEKAEVLCSRLKELIASGQGSIQKLLGLNPDGYPPWLVLSAGGLLLLLLLLLVLLSYLAVRGGAGVGKTRGSSVTDVQDQKPLKLKANLLPLLNNNNNNIDKPDIEQNRRNKKKSSEKVEQAPVQVKKNKKKAKAVVRSVIRVNTSDGNEPDEGAWQTQVSHRERKQQRRKDKVPEDAGSPGGTKTASRTYVETLATYTIDRVPPRRKCEVQREKLSSTVSCHRAQPEVKLLGQDMQERASLPVALQWDIHPDDEWCGLNGVMACDADWSAPLVHWGNYEGPSTPLLEARGHSASERPGPHKEPGGEKAAEDSLINAVVLLILLSALNDPVQYRYHLTSAELGTDIDVMDDASDVMVYPNTVHDYLQQLPGTFPYKEDIMSNNNLCLVFAVLLFVGCILSFKAYLIGCVWNCYRYVSGRGTTEVLVYVTTNDTACRLNTIREWSLSVLLPPYEEAVALPPKEPPPHFSIASEVPPPNHSSE
ncbi:hypothetical protein NHX12_023584, partial [Muraenolepis orangiensis]